MLELLQGGKSSCEVIEILFERWQVGVLDGFQIFTIDNQVLKLGKRLLLLTKLLLEIVVLLLEIIKLVKIFVDVLLSHGILALDLFLKLIALETIVDDLLSPLFESW